MMKEDMISNALIWLLSKLVNFIAASELINPTSACHRPENDVQTEPPTSIGITQSVLLNRWDTLRHDFDIWYDGLPDTFRPCVRLDPAKDDSQREAGSNSVRFSEIWYSIPMSASTMQSYHMARILLLINRPHGANASRSSIIKRLKSYRSIEKEIKFHSYEICGIALSRPEASIRVHQLQPLFVAGQCLTEPDERRVILDLLRRIEADLGWATEYRVRHLLKEWDWNESEDLGQA